MCECVRGSNHGSHMRKYTFIPLPACNPYLALWAHVDRRDQAIDCTRVSKARQRRWMHVREPGEDGLSCPLGGFSTTQDSFEPFFWDRFGLG